MFLLPIELMYKIYTYVYFFANASFLSTQNSIANPFNEMFFVEMSILRNYNGLTPQPIVALGREIKVILRLGAGRIKFN
jgi:hypothetical protein